MARVSNRAAQTGDRPSGIEYPECIVIWDGDYLEVCGEPVLEPKQEPISLLCRTWVNYDRIASVPGDAPQWLEIDRNQQTVTIRVADFGQRPLFFYLRDSLCVIAPAILPLAEALVERGRTLKWDRVGILEALLQDHPFRHRTYFDGIQRTGMGEEVILRLRTGEVDREKKWTLRFAAPDEPRRSLDDAVEILSDLTTETPLPEGAMHPLSGGYDSRLLLCLAVAEGRRPRTLTFGEFGSADLTMARRLAEHLDVPNEIYAQRPEDLWTHGIDVSTITGGMVTPAHRHIYSMFRDMGVRQPIVHGYLGESFAGQSAVAYDPTIDEGEALLAFLQEIRTAPRPIAGQKWASLWDGIEDTMRESIRHDVRRALTECTATNPPSAFPEYFHHVDRHAGMVSQVVSMFEMFGPCTYPYATRAFADFFNAAPYEDRCHRRLFFQAARALFPEAFSLPSLDRPWGARISWRTQNLMKTARNAVQLATDLATGGRFVAFSPFWTEQQDYLIGRHYRPALEDAVDAAEGLLDTDLSSLRYSRLPKWGNSYRQLRLIGLHGLMQHPTYRTLTGQRVEAGSASSGAV